MINYWFRKSKSKIYFLYWKNVSRIDFLWSCETGFKLAKKQVFSKCLFGLLEFFCGKYSTTFYAVILLVDYQLLSIQVAT